MDTYESLLEKYQHDQDQIAKKRKAGLYAIIEEDVNEQKKVWEDYLFDRFKLEKSKKELDILVSYFSENSMSLFIGYRERYFNGEITRTEYENLREQIAIDFENMMDRYGVTKGKMTKEYHKKYWDKIDEIENRLLPNLGKPPISVYIQLCNEEYPVGISYFNDFITIYVDLQK